MKRTLLALLLGGSALALAPAARAQTVPDSTSTVKPQLNTGPPADAPRRPTTPAPTNPSVNGGTLDDGFPTAGRGTGQPELLQKLFLYSNFGLGFSGFGNAGSQFSANISPALGYRLTERLAVGPGITYAYNHLSFPGNNRTESYSTSSYGVKVFSQFVILDELFVHAEYETTYAQVLYQDQITGAITKKTLQVNTPLAGLGYRQQFSQRAAADIVLLYNFNDGINDIYGQPVIRFCFLFNLK
ncbi:hypothetical protein LJY25_00650 [Hymenobacter sp. BT175]|uniref:hypothetical protein n=1 Tax=Hymenobacter translucens TaxID=2886507 RepID=UPI001D0EF076|nr:hypothetical protein [Hymenobacter translucens]MCC2544937.1 hypothetical protein [Hymenobacter translucens]